MTPVTVRTRGKYDKACDDGELAGSVCQLDTTRVIREEGVSLS